MKVFSREVTISFWLKTEYQDKTKIYTLMGELFAGQIIVNIANIGQIGKNKF